MNNYDPVTITHDFDHNSQTTNSGNHFGIFSNSFKMISNKKYTCIFHHKGCFELGLKKKT